LIFTTRLVVRNVGGFPTSEVFRETTAGGGLTQYYQRGVIDWHQSATCDPPGSYCFERRLTWDSFGGGADGSVDMGVEPNLFNSNTGEMLGPWRHKVSDLSVERVPIGFLQFFERYGGVASFGYPKNDARYDTDPRASLRIQGATPGFIRQYFQSAVMEFHPGEDTPVQLRLLGDDVRNNIAFPNAAWKAYASFRDAAPLSAGVLYHVEEVSPGPRRLEAVISAFIPSTTVCSAVT
jgi:hypothetical protein